MIYRLMCIRLEAWEMRSDARLVILARVGFVIVLYAWKMVGFTSLHRIGPKVSDCSDNVSTILSQIFRRNATNFRGPCMSSQWYCSSRVLLFTG